MGFSVVVAAVIPSKGHWAEFFILQNGSDTSDCGGSVDSGCASLLQVLYRHYAEPPKLGLQITTDTSLVIDKNIVVSFVVMLMHRPSLYAHQSLCC